MLVALCAGTAHAELVGHWKFNEGEGTIAHDSSGNGNDGTLEGSPQWVPGQIGNALAFDGNSWVNCGDILTLTEALTITCWVNPDDLTGDRGFVTREASFAFKSSGNILRFTTPGILDYNGNNTVLEVGVWQHVSVTFVPSQTEGLIFYLNGVESDRLNSTGLNAGTGPFRMGNNQWSQLYLGMIDDVQVYDHILTPEEIGQAMLGGNVELAGNPVPEDGTVDVAPDVVLQWSPGEYAAEHDVYLGTNFDDVNDATTNDSAYQGRQAETSFDAGALDLGVTYFWRIDEVNAAPDSTVFKGSTWSFEIEPVAFAVPIGAVSATASSTAEGQDPNNTVNGFGLNENDQHSNLQETMWLATAEDITPAIQYEFAQLQKLEKVHVWNHNTQTEPILGFGFKEALIESSLDGENWTEVGTVELGQATGMANYPGESVDLGGVVARFIRITGLSNFSILGLPQKGLSEVRFYAMPMRARLESPATGSAGQDPLIDLSWRAGRDAAQHDVLIGTDPNTLTSVATVDDPAYTASLPLDSTVYWQINEINDAMDPAVWEGDLWSMTTAAYVTVDDMESYQSQEGSWVWETWTDGFGDDNNGALLGHGGDDMETGIVYDGGQSLPYTYGQGGAANSEAVREIKRDWGQHGIVSLSLMFYGSTTNVPGQMYIKVNDEKIATFPTSSDLTLPQWQAWTMDLPASALGNVETLAIGFEGGSGVVYIDAIRLYAQASELISPVDPGTDNLVSYYALDGDFTDSVSGHNGTPMGTPTFVSDPARGQVLSLDGFGSAADVPYTEDLNPEAFTVSIWANPHPDGLGHRSPITSRDDGPAKGYIIYLEPGNTWQFWTGGPGWNSVQGSPAVLDEWTHLGITYADELKRFYINGFLAGEGTAVLDRNTAQPLRIGGGASEGPGNYFFLGLLDDLRIYNRALTQAEAMSLGEREDPIFKEF
jgi:hypothetical protein